MLLVCDRDKTLPTSHANKESDNYDVIALNQVVCQNIPYSFYSNPNARVISDRDTLNLFAVIITLSRLTQTLAFATKSICPTSSLLVDWLEWLCTMESCLMVLVSTISLLLLLLFKCDTVNVKRVHCVLTRFDWLFRLVI